MPAHAAVETSKVFIREVMAIDPLWLTELAYGPSANVAGLIRESGDSRVGGGMARLNMTCRPHYYETTSRH